MRRSLRGYYALDGGALIELCLETSAGEMLRGALKSGKVVAYTHDMAVVEALYILCRKVGWEEAKRSVDSLLLSGFLNVEAMSGLSEEASKIKCKKPIAVSDCLTLALAIRKGMTALFADREAELLRQMEREPLGVDVEFISDW
jgi:predicted nucleic acid-binding protein